MMTDRNAFILSVAFVAAVSSDTAPIITRSVPTAATDDPNPSPKAGVGLMMTVSNVPLVVNKYAAPAPGALVPSIALISIRSPPTDAREMPNFSRYAGLGLVKVVSKVRWCRTDRPGRHTARRPR